MMIEGNPGSFSQRFAKAKNAEALIKELVRLRCPWRLSVPEPGRLKVSYQITNAAADQLDEEFRPVRKRKNR